MDVGDEERVRAAIADARERTQAQIDALERSVASIVEATELTNTDDEHDPEGATIAYERAQALALLRQARADLAALDDTTARLDAGVGAICSDCGRTIALERLLALPNTRTCVECAR